MQVGTAVAVSEWAARKARIVTASAYLILQCIALASAAPPVEIRTNARTFSMTSMSFDETTETLTLPLDEEFTSAQTKSAWNIMISSAHQQVTVVPHCEAVPLTSSCIDIVRPPAPMLNVRAPALYHAMFHLPCHRPFEKHCRELEASCSLTMRNFGRDGAPANALMLAHAVRTDMPRACVSEKLCTLHCCKHCEAAVLAASGFNWLGKLYAMALSIRTAGYYTRLLHALRLHLMEHVHVHSDPPPVDALPYAEVLVGHMSDAASYDNASSQFDAPTTNGATSERRKHWLKLPKLINGHWCDGSGSLSIDHHCTDARCCNNYDHLTAVKKIFMALLDTVFAAKPPVPSSIKWTRLGPCLDWVMSGSLICGILPAVYKRAFGELSASMLVKSNALLPGQHVGRDLRQDVDWAQVFGKRVKEALSLLHSTDGRFSMLVLLVLMEPMRFFMQWVMNRSRLRKDKKRGVPPLFDLCWVEFSPLLLVRQYYSTLLNGDGIITRLIWQLYGCVSFDAWWRKFPLLAVRFRRLILVAEASFFRKIWKDYMTYPWQLCSVADLRIPLPHRLAAARRFLEMPICCLDEFFSYRLRAQNPDLTADELCSDRFWLAAILLWAWGVVISIMSIENEHAGNRQRVHGNNKFAGFAARYINSKSKTLQTLRNYHRKSMLEPTTSSAPSPDTEDGTFLQKLQGCKRKVSPLTLFKRERLHDNALSGMLHGDEFKTAAWHAALKDEYEHLPPLKKARLHDIAALSNIAVDGRRVEARVNKNIDASLPQLASSPHTEFTAQQRAAPEYVVAASVFNSLDAWFSSGVSDLPTFGDSHSDGHKHPVSPPMLQAVIQQTPGRSTGVAKHFATIVGHTATGSDSSLRDHKFPASVQYPQRCPAICCQDSYEYWLMSNAILKECDAYRRGRCKPCDFPCQDVVAAFELTLIDGEQHVYFAAWPVATGRSANVDPVFVFMELSLSHGEYDVGNYGGIVLQHRRSDFVAPRFFTIVRARVRTRGVV
jgi:hypothetical protein